MVHSIAEPLKATFGNTALVFDSPHSGTEYPDDFAFSCDFALLRQAEDTHVEKIWASVQKLGASWLEARFPRRYIDPNRDLADLDIGMIGDKWPYPTRTSITTQIGMALIWREATDKPIYSRKLTVQEVEWRIEQYWKPYHAALSQLLETAHEQHGL